MAKKYELLYVLNGTLPTDELRAQMERVASIVEASAEIVGVTEWGRRRLAYEIQDLREGYYVLVHFNAEPDAPREIERLMRIADYVLRYLIVVAEGSFMPVSRRAFEDEGAEAKEEAQDAADEAETEETVQEVQPEEEAAQDQEAQEAESVEEATPEETEEVSEEPERTEE
ncbi:MAG: 30S ribosomal protein S6 [Saccharofermentanales bacterium]|jgi:small subunit ribosomal protein S6